MITMSNDFKNSISKTEREMKGYVEVLYTSSGDKADASLYSSDTPLYIDGHSIDTTEILDNERKGKNYASLEENYFKLDGSFVLPNNVYDENPGIGFVSGDIFEDSDMSTTPIDILTGWQTTQTNCNGITIYFQNNIPLELEVQVKTLESGSTVTKAYTQDDMAISSNGVVSLAFEPMYISEILIYVNDVLYPKQRVRIQEVDFGLSTIYEGEDLISFKTLEQCNRFGFDLPINECTIEIGDFDNKFDINNPKNLTNYLTKDVIFKPYVGVLTEDNGIEYCPQGWYWFDTYQNEKGKTTFNCKGFLNKLQENAYCVSALGTNYIQRTLNKNVAFMWTGYGSEIYDVDNDRDLIYKLTSGLEMLKKQQIYYSAPYTEPKDQSYFIDDMGYDYGIEIKGALGQDTVKTIKKEILKDNTKIEKVMPIKNMNIKEYQYIDKGSANETIYETTVVCDGEETLVYDYGKPTSTMTYIIADNYTGFEIIDARNHIYDKNNNLIYTPDYGGALLEYSYAKINYVGTITFRVVKTYNYDEQINENNIQASEDGQEITIDNELINGSKSRNLSNYLGNFIIDNWNDYNVSFEYNGDPSIELGDCIKVENKYSTDENPIYNKVWVTKIESEYKGSFNQMVEGDIIEN